MEFPEGFLVRSAGPWSLCEPLFSYTCAFSWKRNERSPQALWIPGISEVRLGTFLPAPQKGFLARKGILKLLYSDPGILNPAERLTGWKQMTAVDWLSALREHPAGGGSGRPCSEAAAGGTWAWLAEKGESAKSSQKGLYLSAGRHSELIMKEMDL